MKVQIYFDVEPWMKLGDIYFNNPAFGLSTKSETAVRYKCVIEIDDPDDYETDETVTPIKIERERPNYRRIGI